ncbi:pantoate--beta-alanine ligase [Aureibaculum marinum]|uniref:Pantothenate synthetase n=1 Tax=Aureibaculum marinum TaxID=2487930 RepID=A0A3N4NQ04_9FLAO|nr:pantoate--beta-alanine ligase [Aureibaculum marinum]RPD96597.1 pantoate--beta-alanine ligase [Aureibaculum marinum]
MEVFYKKETLKAYLNKLNKQDSVGFVPTMGALHDGHLSLIKRAKKENNIVIVSIFVNPTQFDKQEDLIKYPKDLTKDLKLLEKVNCDVVFAPEANEIYDNRIKAESFVFDGLEDEMEGKHRKGHFDGVGTIVKKLFEITSPDKAYFGEKDFQQLQIIKKVVEKFELPIKIVPCDIYRENDGLAMSSRNVRLIGKSREEAPFIYKTLQKAKEKFEKEPINEIISWVEKEFSKNEILDLEYFEIADETTLKPTKHKKENTRYRAFIAVLADNVRLIDNIALN